MRKRPIAGADTAALQTTDFASVVEAEWDEAAYRPQTPGYLALD